MTALVSLWSQARDRLIASGVDTPVFDARLLVEAGANVKRLDIITDPRRELTDEQVAGVEALLVRRCAREPLSHILGRKAFWTLDFAVTPGVLTPRPETEYLVELALQRTPPEAPTRILDLGVGSGAILLSVLNERPHARGIGVDLSPDALAVAKGNAELLGLTERAELHHGGWDADVGEGFDLLLANPPYIPTADIDTLAPEVARFEPRMALDGGPDGLDAYRGIIAQLPKLVRPGGFYAFEVGKDQADAVVALLAQAGFHAEQPRRDLAGIARVVWGIVAPNKA